MTTAPGDSILDLFDYRFAVPGLIEAAGDRVVLEFVPDGGEPVDPQRLARGDQTGEWRATQQVPPTDWEQVAATGRTQMDAGATFEATGPSRIAAILALIAKRLGYDTAFAEIPEGDVE